MKRYLIKEGFLLQTHQPSPRSMRIGEYFTTEDEAQIEELTKFTAQGSCMEQVSQPKEEESTEEKKTDVQELDAVPGVGKKLLEKLIAADITTVEQLKAFVEKEEAKELLGLSYEKILKHFQS